MDWDEIVAAVGVALGGDRDRGLHELTACWDGTTEGDHAKRCVIAHYLADLQDDLAKEVAWDEPAVAAHPFVEDVDLAPVGIPSARALGPSLHLNLGDGYLRQGRIEEAQTQLSAGLAAQDALPRDGYGGLIRSGLIRLGDRLRTAHR